MLDDLSAVVPCRVCGKKHTRARYLNDDAQEFLRELGVPDTAIAELDDDLRREYALFPPVTGKPGRPAKYLTEEEKRAGRSQRQREYRQRQKQRDES